LRLGRAVQNYGKDGQQGRALQECRSLDELRHIPTLPQADEENLKARRLVEVVRTDAAGDAFGVESPKTLRDYVDTAALLLQFALDDQYR